MKKIIKHFKISDPVLHKVLLKLDIEEIFVIKRFDDPFLSLCIEIITQQLASKAARVIFERFLNLFPQQIVTSEKLLKIPDQKIRDVGTSWAKVKYLKDLAQKVATKELDLENLDKLSDLEVMENLIKVKGIGRWTAEMFLIFYLGREDIFSHGDLGLKRAIEKIYNLKDPTLEEVEVITLKWSPYRSYASRILWKSLDNE